MISKKELIYLSNDRYIHKDYYEEIINDFNKKSKIKLEIKENNIDPDILEDIIKGSNN